MKKLIAILIFLLAVFQLQAQNREIDSLKHLLSVAKHDTTRVYLLCRLGLYEQSFQKGVDYAQQAFDLAEKIGYRKGVGMALNQMGNQYLQRQYARALNYYFQALQIREEVGDMQGQAGTYGNIGSVYESLGDYSKMFNYMRKSYEASQFTNNIYTKAITTGNLGDAYVYLRQYDSALYYYSRSYEYFNSSPAKYQMGNALNGLALVHNKLNNRDLALNYYRMAIENGKQYHDTMLLCKAVMGISTLFRETGNTDSSIAYAQQALDLAQRNQIPTTAIEAGKMLSELYHNKDDKEAYRYLRIAMEAKDSAFSKEKQLQIENMGYAEQERQKEAERKKFQQSEERKENLQYAAIGLALVTFIILFFVFSHSIIANQKLIRFLGVIALLIVFEFLNLLLHPWLGAVTHHSPILMLLAMVCVAALLIPLHHRLEHWITHRLVEKNKKIRVAAAKKIIQQLEPETTN